MKTQTPYVKLLHLLLFSFFLTITNAAYSQTTIEGFGAGATGGAGQQTVRVTNLNSSGAGSLANAIGSNRTIVFDVSGTITGRFDITNVSYMTIDATGRDITINGNNNGDAISFDGSNTHHCILRGVHVTNAGNDGINVVGGAHDIAIANCTSYGNRDGNIDIAEGNNVTVQYCILGGGASGWSGAMLITARNVSVHHNLISPSTSGQVGERCPLIHCNYSSVGSPNADFRNNVVWKWGRNGGTGSGYGTSVAYNATANVVNNYYYSTASPGSAVNSDDGYGAGATGKVYASGNVSGNNGVNPNSANNHAVYTVPAVTTQDACTAASLVIAHAGPSPRNSIDQGFLSGVTLPGCSAVPANQPPVANAGNDITLTLPADSTTLTGSGTDANGTITSYAWSWVSGPATFTFGSANAARTTLTNLVQGVYIFKLTVTDNNGATDSDSIKVTVNAAVPGVVNQLPVANAGNDITLTLPADSATLRGNGTDANGTITGYAWSRVSGPATFTFGSGNAATTTLINLVQGVYVFKLTVTDNNGATDSDSITVRVNAAAPGIVNQAPVARTADSIVLVLPVNSTFLSGTASTDADGIITSYEWAQVSGPTQITIGDRLTVNAQLTDLAIGMYVFRLKVTDDDGASATKNIRVIVKDKNDNSVYFNIYPNPTPGGLTLQYMNNSNGKFRILVYDATRRLVKDGFVDKTQALLTETMDVSNLKNGIYIIQIVLPDGKTAAKQFVKM